ncbi:MAG: peptidase inhibitor family I36 protein [Desulfococcaceae bacterium]
MSVARWGFFFGIFLLLTAPVSNARAQVAFFEDYDGRGNSFRAGVGNRASLPGNWNDRISSVRVDDGYVVVVYEHFNFQGRTETIVGRRGGTLYNLNTFNDQTSSYRVRRDRPGSGPPSEAPDHRRGPVTFFEDFEGSGPRFSDDRDRSNLGGRWNDRISSVWVADGYEVTVYEHSNFEGERRNLAGRRNGALYDLRNFNDRVSSYRIRRGHYDDGYGPSPGPGYSSDDPYYGDRPYYGTGTATGAECFIGASQGFTSSWPNRLRGWLVVPIISAGEMAPNGRTEAGEEYFWLKEIGQSR